ALSTRKDAPAAAACALSLGQPSRGATSLRSVNPKLAMARAAKPIFSPSCGLTRMIAGAGGATVGADLGKAAFVGACLLRSTRAFTMEAHSFCVSENLAPPTPPNPFFDPQRVFAGHYPRGTDARRFGEPLPTRRA